jgi:hypothetical protein
MRLKVAGSTPDEVAGFFYCSNHSNRTMGLGLTQPLTEMSTRNLPGRKGRSARKDDLTVICESVVQKMWEPRRLTTLWAPKAYCRDNFTFLYLVNNADSSVAKSPRCYTD